MSEASTNDERTILDYLNEDCWRAVLEYVPVKDVIRTEPTSRRWQEVVLGYLRGIRIKIEPPPFVRPRPANRPSWFRNPANITATNVCNLKLTEAVCSLFEKWTHKLGPSVVTAYCDSVESMNIYENCPNLEDLTVTLAELETPQENDEILLKNQNENFKWLRRLCFKDCAFVSDRVISHLMTNNSIEELKIYRSIKVTGKCFMNKKSINLNSLSLYSCYTLKKRYLFSANLSQLTKLELAGLNREIYEEIHLLLDKMPKLEHIKMLYIQMNGSFFKSVCRLSRLKHLHASFEATDEDLAAVTRSCQELQSLELTKCSSVTGRGLAAACAHAGARLEWLGLARATLLTDDDVVACVYACPKLTRLDLLNCRGLSPSLLQRAAAARRALRARRPLHVRVMATRVYESPCQEQYEGLIIYR